MKKIFMLMCMALFLAACGTSGEKNASEAPKNNNQQEDSEETNLEVSEKEDKTKSEETKTIPPIKIGEVAVVEDFAEITIKGNNFGQEIHPPNRDQSTIYTYYESKEPNQVFLDTVISVKSLQTTGKPASDFVSVKIIYDDKYEYTAPPTLEESGGTDFTYPDITLIEPLQTGVLHFMASVPAAVENDGKPLKAVITVNGNTYEQIIR